jgi:glycolate oxidase FAD binding subunit
VQPSVIDKLRSLVGAPHVLTGVECSPYVLEGRTPDAVVFPGAKDEVAALLTLAADEGLRVTPWGGGTKMAIGSPPARLGLVLGLRRLNRLLEHEPGDLTATVEAGMTFAALQAELGKHGQWLSLDPPFGSLATVGGILAANASGPRRHLYGTARDVLIGVAVVSADGSVVRGGGKVVKNVAGCDLPKLYIGSFGTLGIIAEATFKLRPRPDVDRLVTGRFERLKDAGLAARAVMGSDLIPSALDLADGEVLRGLGGGDGAALLVGIDGIAEQVEWQCAELERLLTSSGCVDCRVLDGEARDEVWRREGELGRRVFGETAGLMKWGVLPAQVAELMEQGAAVAQRNGLRAGFAAHAGVGIVSAVLAGGNADTRGIVSTLTEWRGLANAAGGHALLEWAPLAVKEQVAVWDAPGPAHRIMKRIKDQLDPRGTLNPGRFVGEI